MMKNKHLFKNLNQQPIEVPTDLKENVMGTVAAAKLMIDSAPLITSDHLNTVEVLLKTQKGRP
ncbi:MAG: hypothetical protein R6V74_00215 [Lutibacter sp.]